MVNIARICFVNWSPMMKSIAFDLDAALGARHIAGAIEVHVGVALDGDGSRRVVVGNVHRLVCKPEALWNQSIEGDPRE